MPAPTTTSGAGLPDEVKGLLGLSPSTVRVLKVLAIAVGVIALVAGYLGRNYGWLEYKPGGVAFQNRVQPIFAGLFLLALLVALKREIAGGMLAGFAGAGIIAFAVNQLEWWSAAVVIGSFAVPALLWILVDLNDFTRRTALFGVAATAAVSFVGYGIGEFVYEYFWGPTHPESEIEALSDSPVMWVWTGAVSTDRAEVRAKPVDPEVETARLWVSTDPELNDGYWAPARDEAKPVLGFELLDLTPATEYQYAVEINGELDTVRSGTFTTHPDGPAGFTVTVGACARVGSNGVVFDTIRRLDPLFHLIAGDLHYGDIAQDDIERYREVMDFTLTRPAQAALYRSTPVAYVWDDHDYGANDSGGFSPSRQAVMAGYREYVPSYELAGPSSAVFQAFTVGRIRFILTDARSARDLESDIADGTPSMLGLAQREWLMNELVESAANHGLVVWVNPVPWVAEADPDGDHWGGYADERELLANHIADNGIDNLVMVSGDAHMVAIDDGSNTNYSDGPGPGFPLLHAAPLDRPGSIKGGPYSEGAVADGGQFGTLRFEDRGSEIETTLTALDWEGNELLRHTVVTPTENAVGTSPRHSEEQPLKGRSGTDNRG